MPITKQELLLLCINKRRSGTHGTGVSFGAGVAVKTQITLRTRGAGGTRGAGSACGTRGSSCAGSAGRTAGRARGAGRTGGPGGTLHGRDRQRALHLRLEEELLLNGGLQHTADTLVGGQHIADRSGRTAEAGQAIQDILQFLTLGVEDMAQPKLLHGNGGKELIDRVFTADRRIGCGKGWQRHNGGSPFASRGTPRSGV